VLGPRRNAACGALVLIAMLSFAAIWPSNGFAARTIVKGDGIDSQGQAFKFRATVGADSQRTSGFMELARPFFPLEKAPVSCLDVEGNRALLSAAETSIFGNAANFLVVDNGATGEDMFVAGFGSDLCPGINDDFIPLALPLAPILVGEIEIKVVP
jgi:hypothetical protein